MSCVESERNFMILILRLEFSEFFVNSNPVNSVKNCRYRWTLAVYL